MQHSLDRRGGSQPTAPASARAAYAAHDLSAAPLPRPTWATPTREQRARALYAAWRAETRDLAQRALLREMLSHFREACVRAGHPDPLRGAPSRPRERDGPEWEVAPSIATG